MRCISPGAPVCRLIGLMVLAADRAAELARSRGVELPPASAKSRDVRHDRHAEKNEARDHPPALLQIVRGKYRVRVPVPPEIEPQIGKANLTKALKAT
jgi:hypothetical protein